MSDVDVTESQVVAVSGSGALNNDFELVPREKPDLVVGGRSKTKSADGLERMDVNEEATRNADKLRSENATATATENVAPKPSASMVQATKLKDMFVPREQDGA